MAELTKILYAEDDVDIQSIAQMALEMMGGYTLKICNNGQEAIDAIADFQPDLLLFDVMMPLVDGPAAFKEIHANPAYQDIPIIFMTAKAQTGEVDEYYEMGAKGVITKPFDPMTLPDQILKIWQK